jgi:hypothetical protein
MGLFLVSSDEQVFQTAAEGTEPNFKLAEM